MKRNDIIWLLESIQAPRHLYVWAAFITLGSVAAVIEWMMLPEGWAIIPLVSIIFSLAIVEELTEFTIYPDR